MMTERIWINRVSREIVFMTVREDQFQFEFHQQNVTKKFSHLKLPLDIAY